VITTVAGGGSLPYPNDGELATDVQLRGFGAITVDAAGNLFLGDRVPGSDEFSYDGAVIRRVDASTGRISTIAGGGPVTETITTPLSEFVLEPTSNPVGTNGVYDLVIPTSSGIGDGGPAEFAYFREISDLAFDSQGRLYVADLYADRIRKIDLVSGNITTVAGSGAVRPIFYGGSMAFPAAGGFGYSGILSGDGGAATSASLLDPLSITFDGAGNLYIADGGELQVIQHNAFYEYYEGVRLVRIRRVDAATGIISSVVGTGPAGYVDENSTPLDAALARSIGSAAPPVDLGDGGPASEATLTFAGGVAVDFSGNLFLSDFSTVIRRVDRATGIIETVAGTGVEGYSGDGGPATAASLTWPYDLAFDASGNLYVVDEGNFAIRRINGIGEVPSTFTETGSNVVISPFDPSTGTTPVELTFATVFQSGQTSILTSESGSPAPIGFKLGEPPVYFTLTTSAEFDSAEICFDYSSYLARFGSTELDLFHGLPGGTWERVTTSNDTTNHVLCGVTTSFSPFAIMEFAGPVADAGADQSIHAGALVHLDGTGSYSANTPTESLAFAWAFNSTPAGSAASLVDADTSTPVFVADLPGAYEVTLVVTDLDGVASNPDRVNVSSLNQAPTANAGPNVCAIDGNVVTLDGTASFDPDHDALSYAWTVLSKPAGSTAVLLNPSASAPTITPDLSGVYTIQLVVDDGFSTSAPSVMLITSITPLLYAERITMEVIEFSEASPPSAFTNLGNKRSFELLLHEAVRALQSNTLKLARKKLREAIDRTDGCVYTGTGPDATDPSRDWVVDAATSASFFLALTSALTALE
jgi:hypothetical protein